MFPLESYVEMCHKMKIEMENKKQFADKVILNIGHTIASIEAVCELRDFKNYDIKLFGVTKRTEQEYKLLITSGKQHLFAVYYYNE